MAKNKTQNAEMPADIKLLIEDLKRQNKIEEVEWSTGHGGIKYKTIHNEINFVFELINVANTKSCIVQVGDFSGIYREGSKEYELVSSIATLS